MKKALVLILMCLVLSGCSNNTHNTGEVIDKPQNTEITSNEKHNNTGKTPDVGYATDDLTLESYRDYDSGIYIGDVVIGEAYTYSGITYDNTEDIKEEPVKENSEDSEGDTSTDINITSDVEQNNQVGENQSEISEEQAALEAERLKNEEIKRVANELLNNLYNSMYLGKLVKLNGANSADEFKDLYDISMAYCIKQIKRELENVNYYDSLINSNFSQYTEVNSSWNNIKQLMLKWQLELINVKTDEDVENSNVKLGSKEIEYFENFKKSLTDILITLEV